MNDDDITILLRKYTVFFEAIDRSLLKEHCENVLRIRSMQQEQQQSWNDRGYVVPRYP